jgi:hypothetical protein
LMPIMGATPYIIAVIASVPSHLILYN